MKIAVMQPYLYPYLGYYELMNHVDTFVIFDDVHFIKKGFIHRNFIGDLERPMQINLSLKKASQNKLINEIEILDATESFIPRVLNTYKKSPFFCDVQELCEFHAGITDNNLAVFLGNSLIYISQKILRNPPNFVYSSSLEFFPSLAGEKRVANLVSQTGGSHYINLPGGRSLYSKSNFSEIGVELSFLEPSLNILGRENRLSIISLLAELGWSGLKAWFDELESNID